MKRLTAKVNNSALLLLAAILAGCINTPTKEVAADEAPVAAASVPVDGQASEQPVFGVKDSQNSDSLQTERKQPELYEGTGKTVKLPRQRSPITVVGEAVMINFDATPLEDVVHGVLGDVLGFDYLIEAPISGSVTLRSRAPIVREELLGILESFLQANGLVMIRDEGTRFVITSSDAAVSRTPRFNNLNDTGAGFSNVIVPLKYIGAQEMVDILTPVASEAAFVRVDNARNLLILAGTRAQMDGWLEIVDMFDVDVLSGMSVGIFPIEYSSVEEIISALNSVLTTSGGAGEEKMSSAVKIIPLESLASILVVTVKKDYLETVGDWIQRLDKAPESGAEPQLYVYEVQNGSADHLAQLISSVFGGFGGGSSTTNSRQSGRGVSPGLTPSTLSSDSGTSAATSTATGSQSRSRNQAGASSYALGEMARIVADQVNNTLLIYATSSEYRKISSALKSLDVMPSQILIEASIIEVSLKDNLQYGLEWYFDNELSGGWRGDGSVGLSLGSDGNVSASLPDFGYAFTNPMGQLQVILSALADKDLIKVLSTPSVMVMDNQSASIQVGDSTPVLSSTTEGNYGSTQNISYRDTGVQLSVTPSVNAGGLVTMELEQSVTDVGSGGATNTPSFFERSISSKVAVRSGESVVLGGLISDSQNSKRTGLPFFSDLPLIGWMFGSTGIEEERQELLVIITPHVMKTDQDIRDVTKEMRSRMKGLKAFEQSIDSNRLVNE